ncbi:PAS domain-containing protein [Mucilaginibacter sp. AK015]|uniref:PAS domain-containing protein n=1 Tax=Mucilaginibacter sp. AK015 TaxID=2723072 RepID=UPI0016220DC8|nr:PAS domain-containing protein [Mucilaginibacter sp. AK015]MBB5397916.1 PAS domain S-box-containing protein [Mucilaginibacter sp. AK015]
MKDNAEQLYTLLQSIEGVVWEADAAMQHFTFISDRVHGITGFSPQDWLGRPGFWKTRVHPEDKHVIDEYAGLKGGTVKNHTFEYRMIRADGHIIWIKDNVSVLRGEKGACLLCGVMLDNTVAERLKGLERLERDVLKLNSDLTVSLQNVLLSYLQGLEALFPQMQCSIHRVKNGRLISGVSPSLPAGYMNAIIGRSIGENEGSCGAAAATRQQVIVSDIATDDRWVEYRSLALSYQLKACWANPVVDADGEVMATLAMYYREPKAPTEEELQVMEKATALLRIIMENRGKAEIINETNLLMLQSQEMARFGNWRWDVQQDIVSWSPTLYIIYGLDPEDFKATFAGYQALLHPEDRDRVRGIIENVLHSRQGTQFEERISRPNGDIRYLRSWARLKTDAQGNPIEMIGACLDITETVLQMQAIEQQNRQLLDIAWMQSHMIRSPLTRIMALVELLKDASNSDEEKAEFLDHLLTSANELDEQVKRINQKAEQSN